MTSSPGAGARGYRELERLLRRGGPRLLEHPASIERPKRFSSIEYGEPLRLDRDAARPGILDLLLARPDPVTERRDHLHAGVVRLERELEAQLVVSLAGAAVDDGLGTKIERERGDRLRR